jgi:hypothetical protein
MGYSEKIEDKMKSNEEFRKFMDKIGEEARTEEDRLLAALTARAQTHYEKNKWDYARLFGDKRSDYQNYSDWSLTRINNIIDTIGGALSASDFPSAAVPGSKDASKGTVDAAKGALSAFQGDFSLIIARVTALISGALSQFAVASETKRNSVQQDLPLSGGQHLFFACTGSVFKRETFFTNQFIGSFQIVFETYMSVAEARAISLSQILQTTAKELELLNADLLYFRELQSVSLRKVAKDDPKEFATTKGAYDVMIKMQKADISELLSQYNQYKQVIEAVDRFFPKLDLTEFGVQTVSPDGLRLEHLFSESELPIARRYVRERVGVSVAKAA